MPYNYKRDKWLTSQGYSLRYIPSMNAWPEGASFDEVWSKQEQDPFELHCPNGKIVKLPRASMREYVIDLHKRNTTYSCNTCGKSGFTSTIIANSLQGTKHKCGVSGCDIISSTVITYSEITIKPHIKEAVIEVFKDKVNKDVWNEFCTRTVAFLSGTKMDKEDLIIYFNENLNRFLKL